LLTVLGAVVALGLVPGLPGCVDSRCTRNAECPTGQVCLTVTGACEEPECTSDLACGQGRVCQQFACLPGCRVDAECPDDQRCFSNHCVPRDASCDCAAAPSFCGVDLNPRSPTAGETVCVPDSYEHGVLLFFGSVLCSHCQALLDALEALQVEVAPGGDAPMIFVQEPSIEVSGEVIEGALAGSSVAVVQDDPDLGIWPAFSADWYHVVLVDRNGCQARHWGPLVPSDVTDGLHREMHDEWSKAREVTCTPVQAEPVEPGPEAVEPAPEVVPEVAPDAPVDLPPEPGPADVPLEAAADVPLEATDVPLEAAADVPVEVGAEATPDASGDTPGEPPSEAPLEGVEASVEVVDLAPLDVDGWVEPFELQDLCQVEAGLPAPIGALVPHFLCKDRNPSSPAQGGAISDITLREQVWIAYFGTCT